MTIKLTEDDCRNCTWQLAEETPDYRRYVGHGTHPVTGQPITVQKTEYLAEEALLSLNADERNASDGRRWSSGAGTEKGGNLPMISVGRVPLNKFYAEIAPHLKEGDSDFVKWWLNRDVNSPFRTRRGNI